MTLTLMPQTSLKKAPLAKRGAKSQSAWVQPKANPGLGWGATSWPSLVTPQLTTAPTIQAKLKIGEPNDQYEQEADRVADEVMRIPDRALIDSAEFSEAGESLRQSTGNTLPLQADFPRVQRLCTECEEELQRQPMEEEEELLQTKTASVQPPTESASFQNRITALRGGGQPLSQSERTFFEPRFGTDFSQVRIHTDSRAVENARAVNARAFTLGQNIVFGAGQYQPTATEGRRLLAHELTHTIQQEGLAFLHRFLSPRLFKNIHNDASTRTIQRACPDPERLGNVEPPEACQPADPNEQIDDPRLPSPLRFCFDSDDLIDTDRPNLAELRSEISILLLGGGGSVQIHGYASIPGGIAYNQRLACHRAAAVKSMLRLRTTAPISLHSHGPTSIFGAQDENQRAVVALELPRRLTPPPAETVPTQPRPEAERCAIQIAESLDQAESGWHNALPSCPCTATDPRLTRWSESNAYIDIFHAGADRCFRLNSGSHAQQCCYKRNDSTGQDELITGGSGAGTPDFFISGLGGGSFWAHQKYDVWPFNILGWERYTNYWIPNQGYGCSTNIITEPPAGTSPISFRPRPWECDVRHA